MNNKPQLPSENWKELVVSDLHLTEVPEDEYKWEIFPWIRKTLKQYGIKELYILGDILDKKDRHPSKLINRLVSELREITQTGVRIKILMGNHDYIAESTPFLKFVNNMPGILYLTAPYMYDGNLWLPHTRTPVEEWKHFKLNDFDRIFIHQSIIGAKTSQFYNIEHGLPTNFFVATEALILAGDIHIPQIINDVFYIGSPYPVHYGDDFKGCAVLLNGTKTKRLFRDTIKKQSVRVKSVEELRDLDFSKNDRLKVVLTLEEEEVHSWASYKKEVEDFCKEQGIELKAISLKKQESKKMEDEISLQPTQRTHTELFGDYCEHLELGEGTASVGAAILKQAQV